MNTVIIGTVFFPFWGKDKNFDLSDGCTHILVGANLRLFCSCIKVQMCVEEYIKKLSPQ